MRATYDDEDVQPRLGLADDHADVEANQGQ